MVASDTDQNADQPSKPSGIDLYLSYHLKKLYETDITYWFWSYISYNNNHNFLAKVHHPTIVYKAGTKKTTKAAEVVAKAAFARL